MTRIVVRKEGGSGRSHLLLCDDARYARCAEFVWDELSRDCNVLLVDLPAVRGENWRELTSALLEEVAAPRRLRQISVIGFGGAAAIAQNLVLREAKLVRSLVLVDARTRAPLKLAGRALAALERRLPFGLPLRERGPRFNVRPFLQRLRCPALVVTTAEDAASVCEARVLHERLPVSWRAHCAEPAALCAALRSFQEIPAKRPQKNVRRVKSLPILAL